MYPNNMFFQDDEELAKMLQEGLAKSENVADIEQVPQEFATTIRTDKDRYKLLAKQLGMLSNPDSVRDYSDKISELANQASDNRITQQQMQDVADKQAAIGFLTNPGRSMFYGNGQATDVTPYSIEGNRQFGEDLKKRANVPIDYTDRARRYNSEDLKKLEGVQQLELNELDKKTKAANSVVDRETALQGLKTKMEMDDPSSQISKDAVRSFAQQMDAQIAENMGDSRKRYRDLSKSMAAAKLSAVGSSYNQIQKMMSNDKDMFGRAKNKVDQDIKERYGEQMAAVAGARVYASIGKDQKADEKDMSERQIEDLDFQPGRIPTKEAQKKVSEAKAAHDQLKSIIDRLQTNIEEGGTSLQHWYGKGNEMKQDYENSVMVLKELQRLGVLNGRDEILLKRQLTDPTSISSNMIDQVQGRSELINQYKHFIDRVTDLTGLYARSKNYDDKRFRDMHGVPDTMREKINKDGNKKLKDQDNKKVSEPGYLGDIITQNNITYKWSPLEKKYKPLKVN